MCLIKWQTDKVLVIKGHYISTSYFAESYWIIIGDKIFIVLHLNNAKVILHSDFRKSKGCIKLCNYLTLSRLHFIFSNDFVYGFSRYLDLFIFKIEVVLSPPLCSFNSIDESPVDE